MANRVFRILAVTGTDGCGKTTIAASMQEELARRGYSPTIVWSRFNNYTSLPFLAVTRLTGHNYYRVNAGIRMGFHDFRGFPAWLRWMFVGLQILDVNIASYRRIVRPARPAPLTLCERGPWDSLVDVATDTGIDELVNMPYRDYFMRQVAEHADVLLIERRLELIKGARQELAYDNTLAYRQRCYRQLAENCGWQILENNDTLEVAKQRSVEWLDSLGLDAP